jgi:hypothetical protein
MTLNLPSPGAPLRIGTRGSPLALAQAHETRRRLMAAFDLPEAAFEIVVIKTTGDRVLDRPLKRSAARAFSPARSRTTCWPAASTSRSIR